MKMTWKPHSPDGGGYCELLAWPGIPQVEKYPSLAGAASGIIPAQDLFFPLCNVEGRG